MNRILFIILITILYTSLFGSSFLFWKDKFQASLILPEEKEEFATMLFVGDIMLDRGVEWYVQQHQDWNWPFLKIADVLKKADLVFGNLESIISDKGENQGSIYSFRAEPETIQGLTLAGFNVLSVANNHSLDYGGEAFLDSIERLKKVNIIPVGGGINKKEAHAPNITDIKDTTVAILAYTEVGSPFWQAGENSPGVAWIDNTKIETLKEDILAAKEIANIVIISFHFGEEYQKEPSEFQKTLSRIAIDYGANLVIGHHPHVIQPIERYKHGWIAYSLGNFVFDQGFSPETMEGMMLKVLARENSITQIIPVKIEILKEFQPAISTESTK